MCVKNCLVSHSAATARASGAQRVTEAEFFQNSTNISSPGMQITALDTPRSHTTIPAVPTNPHETGDPSRTVRTYHDTVHVPHATLPTLDRTAHYRHHSHEEGWAAKGPTCAICTYP